MKKVLSLVLSLVMLLSVTAGFSFNAFATVDSVDITLPSSLTPVAGTQANAYEFSTISFSTTGDLIGTYGLNSTATEYQVKNGNSWYKVSATDTFAIGKEYRIKISGKSTYQNNDQHSSTVTCKINGTSLTKKDDEVSDAINFFYVNNAKTILFAYYYFGQLQSDISSLTITGAPDIELGKDIVINPYGFKIDDCAQITNVAIEGKDGTEWKTASKYECNTKYRFVIDVKANDGYTFLNNFKATIKTATANRYSNKTEVKDAGKSGTIYCEFPNALTPHTYGTEGESVYTCTVCGKVDESKIPEVIAPAESVYTLTFGKIARIKKSAAKTVIKVKLKKDGKIAKKKTVSLKIAGKTYKAKTNSKGVAKFTIKKAALKKLKVGKKAKLVAKFGKNATATKKVKVVK